MDETREDNQTITPKSELYLEWNPTGRGGKSVGRREVSSQTLDYSGTVELPVAAGIAANTSVGLQFFRQMRKFLSASGADFALPGLSVISAAAEDDGSESFVEETNVGVYVQEQFAWNDRLFVTLAMRADDHSAFGENFDLVYYPKAAATWVISEEPFWDFPAINTLRLRTAYGQTGLQPGAFDALRTYDPIAGPGDVSTVTPGSVGNPELGPERTDELELGFDAGLFDDRLGVEFTFYNQRTRDAILLQAVSPSTGFPGSRFINISELRNRGVELLLEAEALSTPNLQWDLTFSLAHNASEVIDTGEQESIIVSSSFGVEHRVGYPVGAWFHHRVVDAEFNENGEVIQSSMLCDDGNGGTTACYDGEDIVAPRVFLGQGNPSYEGAISSTFTLFDRVRLNGLIDFKTGFRKWDHVTRVRCALFETCLENVDPLAFVEEDPAALASYQKGAAFGGEYINDSGFFKLREVSLSYVMPDEWAQGIGTSRASITLAARNLHTWTDWTGMEAESRFLGGGRGGFGPLEQNHMPQLTSFVTTVNLSF